MAARYMWRLIIDNSYVMPASIIWRHVHLCVYMHTYTAWVYVALDDRGEVGGWGRDPKKCTGRGWGMGSSTI